MPEINLLPEELRKNEEKESEMAKKMAKSSNIIMTMPAVDQSLPLKKNKPSLLSRLFSGRKRQSQLGGLPKTAKPEPEEELPAEKKSVKESLHLPETQAAKSGINVDFTKGLETVLDNKKSESDKTNLADSASDSEKDRQKVKFSFGQLFSFSKFKADKKKIEKPTRLQVAESKIDQRDQRVLNVDLIPAEMSHYPELELSKKLVVNGLVLLAVILVIGAAYLGITWYQLKVNNELKTVETEITQLKMQISVYENQKEAAVVMQKKLELVRGLLNQHLYWTKFFDRLEKYTINEVYYTNFSMAGTDNLVLSAVGKDYESVAKQLMVFENASDFVTEVKIDAASADLDEDGEYIQVNFNINLVLAPAVFKEPIK